MSPQQRRKVWLILTAALLFGGLKIAAIILLSIGGVFALAVNLGGFAWPERALNQHSSHLIALAVFVLLASYVFSIQSHLAAFAELKKLRPDSPK